MSDAQQQETSPALSTNDDEQESEKIISPDDDPPALAPPKKRGRKKGQKLELTALCPGGAGVQACCSIFKSNMEVDSPWKLDQGSKLVGDDDSDDSEYSLDKDTIDPGDDEELSKIGEEEINNCVTN